MRAAPEGRAVSIFDPASEKMMDFYRQSATEFNRLADFFNVPIFPDPALDELACLLQSSHHALLVEAVVRLESYDSEASFSAAKKQTIKMLAAEGVRFKPGKRPNEKMVHTVNLLTPVFLYFGLKFSISERSKLVQALRIVTAEIKLKGDPREELRRRSNIEKIATQNLRANLSGIWADVLHPSDKKP